MKTIRNASILIPKACDYKKWAVVACDQFTSEREYWHKLEQLVGDEPSTLKLVYPEVYLEDSDKQERIDNINKTMNEYSVGDVFRELKNSCVLVRRTTASGVSRLGIVLAIDLEDYCFTHPSDAKIRSTEGVVLERIPPRLAIRQNAPLELPHIMLLIDDRQHRVIEPLWHKRDTLDKLYDFELNMGGGRLEGYRVDFDCVQRLFDEYEQSVQGLYGKEKNDFIFAVGDGNHSLATAQAHWENVKKNLTEEERESHPARFALCEVENLHDDGIVFEPIHRFVFGASFDLISRLQGELTGDKKVEGFFDGKTFSFGTATNSAQAIKDIQGVIDDYVATHDVCSVDYIHGIEHLKAVSSQFSGVAIVMPKIEKEDLFGYVLENGTLCRKAFSMGEAEEKRYYFEAKRIK